MAMDNMNIEIENQFSEVKKQADTDKMAAYAMKFTKNKDTVDRIKSYMENKNSDEKGE